MATHVSEIRITRRLLRLGDESYPLAHITRVRTGWIRLGRTPVTFSEFVVVLLVTGAFLLVAALGLEVEGGTVLGVFLFVCCGVVMYRLSRWQLRFVLSIETSGDQFAALSTEAHAEFDLRHIEYAILDAIENPPDDLKHMQVNVQNVAGDVIGRDKFQQTGPGSNVSVSNTNETEGE